MSSRWLSNSISSVWHRREKGTPASTAIDGKQPQSTTPTRELTQNISPTSPTRDTAPLHPSTPQNRRNSPRTLSASGSQVITNVLAAHPSFSVFRKSTSLPKDLSSFDSLGSLDAAMMETLVDTPEKVQEVEQRPERPDVSVGSREEPASWRLDSASPTSPRRAAGSQREQDDNEESRSPPVSAESSGEWHLSSVEEMASLNWGDASQEEMGSESPLGGSGTGDAAGEAGYGQGGESSARSSTVRLIDLDSPPLHRVSTSRAPLPPPQVHFSPLSLCPSPLIGKPPPPPTPALCDDSPSSHCLSSAVKAILKAPGTPGTGMSVRFSASTRQTTPPSMARFADAGDDEEQDHDESSSRALSDGDRSQDASASLGSEGDSSTSSGHSEHAVASFLSKLQAAIPSPESSFADASLVDTSLPASADHPRVTISSPTSTDLLHEVDTDSERPKILGFLEDNIFDTSAPRFAGVSHDWSVADTILEQDEEEASLILLPDLPPPPPSLSPPTYPSTATVGLPATLLPSFTFNTSPLVSTTPKQSQHSPPIPISSPLPSVTSSAPPSNPTPLLPANTTTDTSLSFSSSTSFASPSTSFTTAVSSRSTSRRLSSFGRDFLTRRARSSAFAADELGRIIQMDRSSSGGLVYGTPTADSSPGRGSKRRATAMEEEEVEEEGLAEGKSLYFSPTKMASPSPAIPAPAARVVDEVVETVEAKVDPAVKTPMFSSSTKQIFLEADSPKNLFLSPVEEESASTTFTSPRSSIRQSIFSSQNTSTRRRLFVSPPTANPTLIPSLTSSLTGQVVLHEATPDRRRRHARSQSAICPPSPNPFSLQGGNPADVGLVHSLLSAQGDMLANSSSQRFLLSSLITNLRDEIDRKDAMIDNLRQQKDEVETAWQGAMEEAAHLERAAQAQCGNEADRVKLETLEDLIERLTAELETRTATDRKNASRVDEEMAGLRSELQRSRSAVRDGEIRLRHAQASQAEAEALRSRAEGERDQLREDLSTAVDLADEAKRDRTDTYGRLRQELDERDRIIAGLRTTPPPSSTPLSRAAEADLHTRLEEAARDTSIVKAELDSQVRHSEAQAETIRSLCEQNRNVREDVAQAIEHARQLQHALEAAQLDARADLDRARDELAAEHRSRLASEEEFGDARVRIEQLEMDVDGHLEAARYKDEIFREHEAAWQEAGDAQRELFGKVAEVEASASKKSVALHQAHEDLESLRRDIEVMLDVRDRKLGEAQTALASRTAKYEAAQTAVRAKTTKCETLQQECNRLKELVQTLRRESADREVKIVRLRKSRAELEEDNLGLNMALESKQMELEFRKRTAVKPSTTSTTRPALSASIPSTAARPIRPSFETPSHAPHAARKPSLAFGVSSRRTASEAPQPPAPVLSRSRSSSVMLTATRDTVVATKENLSPKTRSTEAPRQGTPFRRTAINLLRLSSFVHVPLPTSHETVRANAARDRLVDLEHLSSSDAGEREERLACVHQAEYWDISRLVEYSEEAEEARSGEEPRPSAGGPLEEASGASSQLMRTTVDPSDPSFDAPLPSPYEASNPSSPAPSTAFPHSPTPPLPAPLNQDAFLSPLRYPLLLSDHHQTRPSASPFPLRAATFFQSPTSSAGHARETGGEGGSPNRVHHSSPARSRSRSARSLSPFGDYGGKGVSGEDQREHDPVPSTSRLDSLAIDSDSSSSDVVILPKPQPFLSAAAPSSASSIAVLEAEHELLYVDNAGRSLRNRTAAQLKPYSIENAKYTRTLLKNGWQGAVVAGPRVFEETALERQKKKEEMERAPKDDLGGWLEYEGGQRVAMRSDGIAMEYSDEDSVDGEELLEREARRKAATEKDVGRAFGTKRKSRDASDDNVEAGRAEEPRTAWRKPKRLLAQSAAGSATPKAKSTSRPEKRRSLPSFSKRHSSDGYQRRTFAKRRRERADSEPMSSSPAKSTLQSESRANRPPHRPLKSRAHPSKSFHIRGRPPDERTALDDSILALSPPPPSASSSAQGSSDSVAGSGSELDSGDSQRDRPPPLAAVATTRLGGKKKKALGMMMPAVFMKRAQADLRLMEKEKLEGLTSGSDHGSGDEDVVDSSADERRKGRARIRIVPRLTDDPLRFDGEMYTDESGNDGAETPAASSEEEGDAVSSWLQAFAPQRQQGRDDEDIVDRFLKRAHGKSRRAPKGTSRRREPDEAVASRKGKGPLKQGASLQNGGNRRTDVSSKSACLTTTEKYARQVATRTVSLDTEQAIFDWSRIPQADARDSGRSDDMIVVEGNGQRSGQQHQLVGSLPDVDRTSVKDDSERWATFGKFSHDFEISRLPVGIQFSDSAIVKTGQLFDLLSHRTTPSLPRACIPFGVALRGSMSAEDLEAVLPLLCDSIFDETSSSGAEGLEGASGEALRFLGAFVSHLSTSEPPSGPRFNSSITSQLDRLDLRLDSFVPAHPSAPSYARRRIVVSWNLVDIAARLAATDPSQADRLRRLISSLVAKLVKHGPEHTTKRLKIFMADVLPDDLTIRDVSVEGWLAVTSLALNSDCSGGAFGVEDFWQIVLEELDKALPPAARRSLVASEVISYTTMMLCGISQFSPSGISTSAPRLHAHWPILMRALEPIQPSALSKADHSVSNTALARRDRYLWTLFARCLVLVDQWGWKVDVRGELIPKLFDLVNARRLADLTIESSSDFPLFLQQLDRLGSTRLDQQTDTAFIIFLKLVVRAADDIVAASEADKRRQLTRLFLRLSPMSSGPWTSTSLELTKSHSILVNHYSLIMSFAVLSPASASQRLAQARRLIVFADVEEPARRTCIRGILYFAFIFLHHGLSLDPVVDWLSSIATHLRTEYVELEKQRKWDRRGEKKDSAKRRGGGDPLWHRAVLLTMVLRSVQLMLRWKKNVDAPSTFPDASLLNPAWTSQLLDSPLSLDPMIGLEVIKCIDCFLDVRLSVRPRQQVEDVNGISQDEFGMFELDYEDPALNALLGVEAGPADAQRDEARSKDLAFAQLINSTLSPAMFRLISNIFVFDHASRGGPTIADRSGYAEQVVECWTRCLIVMVENDIAEWTPYLRYGDQSWKRISDPLGRRDVALFLAVQILKYDSSVFQTHQEEFLEIWFQSIVARRTSEQHTLTSMLLNAERVSPLLEDLPYRRSGDTGQADVSDAKLQNLRLAALQAVFQSAAPFLAANAGLPGRAQALPKSTVLNYLRAMLAAMRDNLSAISDEVHRSEYAAFCRAILERMRGSGSGFNEQNLPEMRTLASAAAS